MAIDASQLEGMCVYDNPVTRCRELWVNGRLQMSVSNMAMVTMPAWAWRALGSVMQAVGDAFVDGRVVGDGCALAAPKGEGAV